MIRAFFFSLACGLGLLSCAAQVSPTQGKHLYTAHCAKCHGAKAQGNGPLASALGTAPANLALLRRENAGLFPTQDVIAKVHGYTQYHDFGDMPSFGQALAGQNVDWVSPSGEVIATPKALLDIVAYLEGVQE